MTTTVPRTDYPVDDRTPPAIPRIGLLIGSLQALIAANAVQIAAGFANADPSPPAEILPGIAATAVLGIAALALVRAGDRLGYYLGIVFCLASMIGMGPHKLFLEDGGTIAPLALVGFALEVTFIVHALRLLRANQ